MAVPGAAWREGFTGVVLAGGSGSRLGGAVAKPEVGVGGRSMLARVVTALDAARRVVVVGGRAAPPRCLLTHERPLGGGPVAALHAALPEVATPVVVVLAVDLPLVDAEVVSWLLEGLASAGPDVAAAVPLDPAGRRQPLAAAYRTAELRAAVAALSPQAGRSVRDLLALLRVAELAPGPLWAKLVDVDTPEELTAARVQDWAGRLAAELGLPLDAAQLAALVPVVLDIARDAAHGVARPAAPVTTFLTGLALGRTLAGSSGASPGDELDRIGELVAAALTRHGVG